MSKKYKSVEIKWRNNASSVYSYGRMEFAWANKDLQQCSTISSCRDYLQDAIHSHYKNECTAYTYDPSKDPKLSFDYSRLIIGHGGLKVDGMEELMPKTLDLVNRVAARLKIQKTVAYRISNPLTQHARSQSFLLVGSPSWMKSPPMISFYTLLMRSSPGHDESIKSIDKAIEALSLPSNTKVNVGDRQLLKNGNKAILRIMKYKNKIWHRTRKDNFPNSLSSGNMHNLGVVGMSSSNPTPQQKELISYWFRKNVAKQGVKAK